MEVFLYSCLTFLLFIFAVEKKVASDTKYYCYYNIVLSLMLLIAIVNYKNLNLGLWLSIAFYFVAALIVAIYQVYITKQRS